MNTNEDRLCARLLVKFCGWKWWAFPWQEDGVWQTVRSLRSPAFPDKNWRDWAIRKCVQIAPATGDEPVMRNCHKSEIIPPLASSLDACAMLKSALLANGFEIETSCWPAEDHETGERCGVHVQAKIRDEEMEITLGAHSHTVPEYSAAVEAMAICRAADAIPEGV